VELKLIWQLITPFWRSEQKLKAWSMLLVVLVSNLLIVYGFVEINQWNNRLYSALQNGNEHEFFKQALIWIPITFALVATFNVNYYFKSILSFTWRKWLTDQLSHKWLKNNNFYRVMQLAQSPDNPDQRISEDLKNFAFNSLELFLVFFKETINLISFSVILWNLSGNFNLENLIGINIEIPGYLVWIALLYAVIGTYIAILIGKPLVQLDYTQEKYEANFRYSLMRIREKREEIALHREINPEIHNLRDCFDDIKTNFYSIVLRTFYLDIWRNLLYQLDTIFPLLVAAPMFFIGAFTLGTLMQVVDAFKQVKGSLSMIVKSFTIISAWIATSRRLTQLEQHLDQAKIQHKHSKIVVTISNSKKLICEDLTIATPTGKTLLKNLNFEIDFKDKILITGKSGVGKSTLVRTLAKLWPYGHGHIILPSEQIFFVPQKPYMPISTLREALETKIKYAEIVKLLDLLKLGHLAKSIDLKQDWGMILSPGEQQRIAIIRLLIHKPEWLIMDEPTSSLDDDLQKIVFKLLGEYLKNSTVITMAHTMELKKYHDRQIDINQFASSELIFRTGFPPPRE
jgi:putative ATP-binding cassette transporter